MKINRIRYLILFVVMLSVSFGYRNGRVVVAEAMDENRYNVVIVLDASGSLKSTDEENLRFEAIKQFVGLLAEEGNQLGGIVFSTGVEEEFPIQAVDSQQDKKEVIDFFEQSSLYSYTNVGAALERAVEMLCRDGDEKLPSVIVFLSDGNTEMKTDEELEEANMAKANAIFKAGKEDIAIYSICLNANREADTDEMRQLAKATGGQFQEVMKSEDLKEVFHQFFTMIYDTTTQTLLESTYSESGTVDVSFWLPGFGVEEVNIIVNGAMDGYVVLDSNGNQYKEEDIVVTKGDTFTLLKLKEPQWGEWTLQAQGTTKEQIKIDMVYNTKLAVETWDDYSDAWKAGDEITFSARLKSGEKLATEANHYDGYNATLQIKTPMGAEVKSVPMELLEGKLEAKVLLDEGDYSYQVEVTGYQLTTTSKEHSITTMSAELIYEAPVPVENQVEYTVNLWPFVGGELELPLKELVKESEDTQLSYELVSSSFLESKDYVVEEQILKQSQFSLSKGRYVVRILNSQGRFCEVEVIVHTRNIGLIVVILLLMAGVLAIVISGILLFIACKRRFRGSITIVTYENGVYSEKVTKKNGCGRRTLQSFGVNTVSSYYFQASGKEYVTLKSKVPFYQDGTKKTKLEINGMMGEVMISLDQEGSQNVYITFTSNLKAKSKRSVAVEW